MKKKYKRKGFLQINFHIKNIKRVLVFLCAALILFALFMHSGSQIPYIGAVTAASSYEDVVTVIIDAGHGGEDGGAVSSRGTVEKDVNLNISLKLRDLLILNGFHVIMTRESDVSIYDDSKGTTLRSKKVSDINNRIALADNNPDAILISIHQNTFPKSSARGSQVFYTKNEDSERLAGILQSRLKSDLGQSGNRTQREAYSTIKLMNNIKNTAVLIECGFLSNPWEEALLLTEDYQSRIVFSIMGALYEFLTETT